MAEVTKNDLNNSIKKNFASVMQQFRETINQAGHVAWMDRLQETLGAWQEKELNVGVIGSSGQGKSTFINTIRRLKPSDEGAARVGVKETTTRLEPYPDRNNPKLIYWDLPGCNTPNFPVDTYFKTIQSARYDFFLLITALRFTETDKRLIEQMKQENKKFYLIRTKIDADIRNQQEDYPESTEANIIKSIRDDCYKSLDDQDYPYDRIFLISGKFNGYHQWSFPWLVYILASDFSHLLREAITLSLTVNGKENINEKFELLHERIWKVALLSACGRVVPIPATSVAIDFTFIKKEIKVYKRQFGLDPDSLQGLIDIPRVNVEAIRRELSSKGLDAIVFNSVTSYALQIFTSNAAAEITKEFVVFIPIIGWFAAPTISFVTTYKTLEKVLNAAKEASLIILRHILQATD